MSSMIVKESGVLEVLAAVALDLVVAQHKLLWEKG